MFPQIIVVPWFICPPPPPTLKIWINSTSQKKKSLFFFHHPNQIPLPLSYFLIPHEVTPVLGMDKKQAVQHLDW